MRSTVQLLVLIALLFPGLLFAQITNVSVDQAPPIPGAGHDYIHLLSETVSPAFGTVNIRIGTPVPSGRGITVPFAFQYDSGGAHHLDFAGPNAAGPYDNLSYLGRGGWSYIVPTIQMTQSWVFVGPTPPTQCFTYDNFVVGDPQGTMHLVGLEVNPGQAEGCFIAGQAWPRQITNSSDGFVTATVPFGNSQNSPPPQVTVYDLDGTTYSFNTANSHVVVGINNSTNIFSGLPSSIETRNGNKVTVTDNNNGAFQITDALGRAAINSSGFGASGNTVSIAGLSNPYTLTWANQPFNISSSTQILQQIGTTGARCPGAGGGSGSQPEVTQITLPNGQSYQFQYDPTYGMLSKIIYPTGAYVRYVWGINNASTSTIASAFQPNSADPPVNPGFDICEGIWATVALQHRYVSFDGSTEVLQQDFVYSPTTWGATPQGFEQWTTKQTTVTTHDLVAGTTQITVYNYAGAAIPELGNIPRPESGSGVHPVTPVETKVRYQDGNGHTLQTVTKVYGNPYLPALDEKTILDNGQTSEIQSCFLDGGFSGTGSLCPTEPGGANLLADRYDLGYGFGAGGPLLRHTHIDYAPFATTPLGATLLDRPCRTITYDGSGIRMSETDALYDGGSSVCGTGGTASTATVGGLPSGTHDETNYSSSSTAPRGNATKVTRKCFIPSTGSTCTDAITTYSYDETGQVLSMTDPNTNTTQYSYADSFTDTTPANNTNAYLTKITHPQTGAVNHIESFSYAFSDGQLTVAKDQNTNQTKYFYNDPLRRLTETDFPDTGQTTVTYNDSALSVVTNKKMDSNHTFTTTVVGDGMGDPVQTQVNSDPSGVDYVDNHYDGLGHIISSSNPHRSASASTDGVTQTQYDALGRPTQITKQDGSVSTVSYAGNCSVAIDEAGKRRRSCSDAMGRLIEVDEPTPGVSESTSATGATATVSISGALQSKQITTTATGTVTISGTDSIVSGSNAYDFGTVTVFVGSNGSVSTSYGNNGASPSSASDVASALCSGINSTSSTNTLVQCTGTSGGQINLQAQASGAAGNGIALAVSARSLFPGSSQSAFASSSTSGSTSGGGTTFLYDSGATAIAIAGLFGDGTTWSGSGTTPSSIATNLASAINNDPNTVVTANASGSTVTLTAKTVGMSDNNIPLACSSTYDSSNFSAPSFSISCSSTLSGGGEAGSLSSPVVTLYNYDASGNLLQVTQQGGTTDQTRWRIRLFTYDSRSRLLTVNNPESGNITYSYDANDNVLTKTDARGIITNYSPSESPIDALNRVTKTTFSDGTPAVFFLYDTPSNWGNPAVAQTNLIGRLSLIYENGTTTTGNQVFGYDPMGRVVINNQCTPSNCGTGNYPLSAAYDLAGNLTSVTYPSGRFVKYFYNAGNLLDQVQFATFNGVAPSGGAFNYWVAADNNFYPNGVPKSSTLGNGITESTALNNRLQLQEKTVDNPAIYNFADHVYNYGTQNNGNILSITDQLNSARTQTFTYDALNRLSTASESRWGLGFVYDAWGNRLQQNVTAGSAGSMQITVDSKNHIQGAPSGCTAATRYCYDAAGNLLHDNLDHQYVYDAEGRISSVDNSADNYVYGATGQRVAKVVNSTRTEYVYFRGELLAIRAADGSWQDYISGPGGILARAQDASLGLDIYGTRCSSCGNQYMDYYLSNAGGLLNYTLRSGDKLLFTQYQNTGARGGADIVFTDGSDTNWTVKDKEGYFLNDDQSQSVNHFRTVDLSSFAGKTITQFVLNQETDTSPGAFSIVFAQMALLSFDGTVHPIYTGQATSPVSAMSGTSGITGAANHIDVNSGHAIFPQTTTVYFGHDHLGSSRIMSGGYGYPLWQSTFLPYGEEYIQELLVDSHKFTGKERDSESGLDYFGARYYGNSLGRFLTPDWSTNPVPVPYADLSDPQSLNQYSYVRNIPLSSFDDDGHATIEIRYTYIGPGYTHSYIVVTDTNGAQTYFRGGPSRGGPSSGSSSGLSSGSGGSSSQSSGSGSSGSNSSGSNSSNSSSPGSSPGGAGADTGPWGSLHADSGSYVPGTIDYETNPAASTTLLSNDQPAAGYIDKLQQYSNSINQANIPYNPLSDNSNAFATGGAAALGLAVPDPPVWAPGARTQLPGQPTLPPPPPPPPQPADTHLTCEYQAEC